MINHNLKYVADSAAAKYGRELPATNFWKLCNIICTPGPESLELCMSLAVMTEGAAAMILAQSTNLKGC